MPKRCVLCGVEQSAQHRDRLFHRCPNNQNTVKQWKEILNRENVKDLVVCSRHFKPDDYKEFCEKPTLQPHAVPRPPENYQLNPQFPGDIVNYEETQEKESLEEEDDSMDDDSEESRDSDSDVSHRRRRKRKASSEDDLMNLPVKKRVQIRGFGSFRKTDFKCELIWKRFVLAIEDLKNEKRYVERKNERLNARLKAFKEMLVTLKEKKLLTPAIVKVFNRILLLKLDSPKCKKKNDKEKIIDSRDFIWDQEHDYAT